MLKILFFSVCLLTLSAVNAIAQPALKIEHNRFEFGMIPRNSTIAQYFWFKSVGTDTLVINKIKTGCTCTLMPLKTDRLAPGDSMKVGIFWNLKNRINSVGRYPYIFTNASPDPYRIYLTGMVIKSPDSIRPIAFSPYKFELISYSSHSIDSIRFKVTNSYKKELTLTQVSYPVDECELSLPQKVKAKSSAYGYIKVKPEYLDKEFKRSITVEVNDAKKTRITVPIRRKIFKK